MKCWPAAITLAAAGHISSAPPPLCHDTSLCFQRLSLHHPSSLSLSPNCPFAVASPSLSLMTNSCLHAWKHQGVSGALLLFLHTCAAKCWSKWESRTEQIHLRGTSLSSERRGHALPVSVMYWLLIDLLEAASLALLTPGVDFNLWAENTLSFTVGEKKHMCRNWHHRDVCTFSAKMRLCSVKINQSIRF